MKIKTQVSIIWLITLFCMGLMINLLLGNKEAGMFLIGAGTAIPLKDILYYLINKKEQKEERR